MRKPNVSNAQGGRYGEEKTVHVAGFALVSASEQVYFYVVFDYAMKILFFFNVLALGVLSGSVSGESARVEATPVAAEAAAGLAMTLVPFLSVDVPDRGVYGQVRQVLLCTTGNHDGQPMVFVVGMAQYLGGSVRPFVLQSFPAYPDSCRMELADVDGDGNAEALVSSVTGADSYWLRVYALNPPGRRGSPADVMMDELLRIPGAEYALEPNGVLRVVARGGENPRFRLGTGGELYLPDTVTRYRFEVRDGKKTAVPISGSVPLEEKSAERLAAS